MSNATAEAIRSGNGVNRMNYFRVKRLQNDRGFTNMVQSSGSCPSDSRGGMPLFWRLA